MWTTAWAFNIQSLRKKAFSSPIGSKHRWILADLFGNKRLTAQISQMAESQRRATWLIETERLLLALEKYFVDNEYGLFLHDRSDGSSSSLQLSSIPKAFTTNICWKSVCEMDFTVSKGRLQTIVLFRSIALIISYITISAWGSNSWGNRGWRGDLLEEVRRN